MRLPRLACLPTQSILASALLLAVLNSAWCQQKTPEAQRDQASSSSTSDYVGAETCRTCHEDIFKNFETTPHFKTTLTKKGPQWQGCEACHGPGKAHVESGGDKSKIFVFMDAKPEDVSKRCLGCHEYGEEHSNFARSRHNTNGVSCVACHSPHHSKEPQFLLVSKQPDLCYGCHTDKSKSLIVPSGIEWSKGWCSAAIVTTHTVDS